MHKKFLSLMLLLRWTSDGVSEKVIGVLFEKLWYFLLLFMPLCSSFKAHLNFFSILQSSVFSFYISLQHQCHNNKASLLASNITWYLNKFLYFLRLSFLFSLLLSLHVVPAIIYDSDSTFALLVSFPTFEAENTFVVCLLILLHCFNVCACKALLCF